ncbi:Protein HID1 [Ceratocystis platani]|uniref:Protein HID1 n=1 Tax=Ceratocystis fimbriata f. sp. platani TaxID=88771 RepID=A0A0F8D2B0_CERFI|nr:Protein HID1 [Ceratocystis platani]
MSSAAYRSQSNAAITTPVKKTTIPPLASESPGTWKHPQLDEIQRRRNASTFTEKNMRQVALSIGALLALWALEYAVTSYLNFDFLSRSTRSYFAWAFTVLHAAPIANIGLALLPLVRPVDNLADIPLSNEQRHLLGLPLLAVPTADAKFSTPPRYSRTPSMADSVNSRASYNGSPLSGRGSPAAVSPLKNSQFSPITSPLQHKSAQFSPISSPLQHKTSNNMPKLGFLGSSTSSTRRPSFGSNSPSLGVGSSSSANLFADLGTPSPASKRASVGLNKSLAMGASDSKLVFKKGILRLSEERNIPADDPYWVSFWELPESAEDVFSLFAPSDIRRTRDNALENLETLVLAATSRLFMLRHHPSFPDPEYAPDCDLLNCVRVLTRILPFIFEEESLAPWEDKFLWGIRRKKTRKASLASEVLFDESMASPKPVIDEFEEAKPLAEELIDTLIELLFFSGFTIQKQPPSKDRVSFAIWQSGDFQFMVDGMTRILNQPLQEKTSLIPGAQNQAGFVSEVLMLFWEVTQSNKRFRAFIVDTEKCHEFVTLSVERNFGVNLNVLFEGHNSLPMVMRIPGFRGSYADFLIHSIYSLIAQSHSNLTAIYPALLAVLNNVAPHLQNLTPKTCNKIMQLFSSMSSPSFLLANETNHDLLRALLETINGIVEHQYDKNPDFVYAVLRHRKRIEALRSFTLESGQEEIERRQRSRKESSASTETYDPTSTSNRSSVDGGFGFLQQNQSSNNSVQSPGLRNVPEDSTFEIGDDEDSDDPEQTDTEEDYRPTPTTTDSPSCAGSAVSPEDAVPVQLRGMSEKARGKLPAGAPTFSRQNSLSSFSFPASGPRNTSGVFEPTAAWIDRWLPELPLHTLLILMQQLGALIPRQNLTPDVATTHVRQQIQSINVIGLEASLIRVHSFEWGPMALGWYEALLWGLIFTSEMRLGNGNSAGWSNVD